MKSDDPIGTKENSKVMCVKVLLLQGSSWGKFHVMKQIDELLGFGRLFVSEEAQALAEACIVMQEMRNKILDRLGIDISMNGGTDEITPSNEDRYLFYLSAHKIKGENHPDPVDYSKVTSP